MSFSKFVKHELRPEPWQLPQRSQAVIPGRARVPGSRSWNPGLRRRRHRLAHSGPCDDEGCGCDVEGWSLGGKGEASETMVAQPTCCYCAFLDFSHHPFLPHAVPYHALVHCGYLDPARYAHCALALSPFSLSSPFFPLAVRDHLPFDPPSAPLFAPFSPSFSWAVDLHGWILGGFSWVVDLREGAGDAIFSPCSVVSRLHRQKSQIARVRCLQYPLCLWLEHRTRWADSQFLEREVARRQLTFPP